MPEPVLHTERLLLRRAGPEDAAEVTRYLVDNRDFLRPFSPLQPPSHFTVEFWTEMLEKELDAVNIRLFLCLRDAPDRFIGCIHLTQIQGGPAQFCNVGYQLDQHAQGRGYMTEALREVVRYAFDELNLHRLHAGYMPHNRRSGAVLRRLGFAIDGYARDYLHIGGRWEDHILTGLVNPNWVDPSLG